MRGLLWEPQGFHMSFHGEKAAAKGPAFGNSAQINASIIDDKSKDSTKEANRFLIPEAGFLVYLEAPTTTRSEGQWSHSVRPKSLSFLPSPKLFQAF